MTGYDSRIPVRAGKWRPSPGSEANIHMTERQPHAGRHRPLDEVVRDCAEMGFIPSFCTACYRVGRTGVVAVLRGSFDADAITDDLSSLAIVLRHDITPDHPPRLTYIELRRPMIAFGILIIRVTPLLHFLTQLLGYAWIISEEI